ncbi:hypothetical protein L209DRAFT_356256 [Thermothelomyces heterothallicus CBS 203.75]
MLRQDDTIEKTDSAAHFAAFLILPPPGLSPPVVPGHAGRRTSRRLPRRDLRAPLIPHDADPLFALHAVVALGQPLPYLVVLGPGAGADLHAHDAAHRVEGKAQTRAGCPSSPLAGSLRSVFEEEEGRLLFSVGEGGMFAPRGSWFDLGADTVDDC